MTDQSQLPVIRTITPEDFQRISEIDAKILGKLRTEFWEKKAELARNQTTVTSLVAEMDGKVVGFIMGDIGRWQYGTPMNVGWIDTIGVDPDYQRRGIAQILFKELVDQFKKRDIETMYAFVNWKEWRLLRFFERVGFSAGDMINLKLDI